MKVRLLFGDDETAEARMAMRAGNYKACLYDLANLMHKATHDEPWTAEAIKDEFWRICQEDWGIDPWGEETC
jgi:hypothetical protein